MSKGRKATPLTKSGAINASDKLFIQKHIALLIQKSQDGYKTAGRGAVWVDRTSSKITGRYVSQEHASSLGWPDDDDYSDRVRKYNPDDEFVVAIVDTEGAVPVYTIHYTIGLENTITVTAA